MLNTGSIISNTDWSKSDLHGTNFSQNKIGRVHVRGQVQKMVNQRLVALFALGFGNFHFVFVWPNRINGPLLMLAKSNHVQNDPSRQFVETLTQLVWLKQTASSAFVA